MQITPAALDAIYYNFDQRFQQGFERPLPWSERLASTIPSTGREERYAFMRLIPRLREWIGERMLRNVEGASYTLVNKDFEGTVELDRNDIEDDRIGLYGPTLEMLGQQAKLWPDDLVLTILQAGTSGLCYDGQAFFADSHPAGDAAGSTFDNNFASTALTAPNLQTVRATMMAYKDADGKTLRVDPRLLIVPPQLEATARQIANAEFIAPAGAFGQNAAGVHQTNVLKGVADVMVIPDLANEATTWYLADVSKPIKPLIFQQRKAPVMVSLTDPTSENVFMRKKFIYGVDCRGNAGYGLPFLMARAIA